MKRYSTPDMSMPENQERFNKLDDNFKKKMIEAQVEEAAVLRTMMESGRATDYEDALQKYLQNSEGNLEIIMSGSEASQAMREGYDKETTKAKERLSKKGLDPNSYSIPAMEWNNDRGLLATTNYKNPAHQDGRSYGFEVWEEGEDKLAVNGQSFYPDIYFIEKTAHPELQTATEQILNHSFFVHKLNVMGETRTESLEEIVADIGNLKLESNGGFYVTTVANPWNTVQGDRRISIYLNEHLLDLLTPTEQAVSALESGEHQFFREPLMTGGRLRSLAMGMEQGYPDRILKLLSGLGRGLSYYNDVLGVLVEVDVTFGKSARGSELAFLHFNDGELVKLLAYDPEIHMPQRRVDAQTISMPVYDEVKNLAAKNNGRVIVMMPIIRITPETVSGIVESDKNGVVKKVAIQEKGKFKTIE